MWFRSKKKKKQDLEEALDSKVAQLSADIMHQYLSHVRGVEAEWQQRAKELKVDIQNAHLFAQNARKDGQTEYYELRDRIIRLENMLATPAVPTEQPVEAKETVKSTRKRAKKA